MRYLIKFTFVFLLGCINKKTTNVSFPALLADSIIYKNNFISSHAENINEIDYRPSLIQYKKKDWYSFLSREKNKIYLFDFENPMIKDTILLGTLDTLSAKKILRYTKKGLISYKINSPHIFIYKLGDSIENVRKLIVPAINSDKIYIKNAGGAYITFDSSIKIILNYGLLDKPKTSYLDWNNNLLVIDGSKSLIKKIGFYPSDYFDKKKYLTNSLFDIDDKGNIYFTFELHDSIYKITESGTIKNRAMLSTSSEFKQFNWRKETDLAYVRQYIYSTEANISLTVFNDSLLFILKRLPEPTLLKTPQYKYVILDTSLKIKYTDTLRHGIYTNFIGTYKNGILLLSNTFDKAYLYEVK